MHSGNLTRASVTALTLVVAGALAFTSTTAASATPQSGVPASKPAASAPEGKRTVVYYQTQYRNDQYVSLAPLTRNHTGITDLILAAIHVNETPGDLRLNDDPPSAAKFDVMWDEIADMQAHGVDVIGMVGGAARGSFERLDGESFDTYYPYLKQMIADYKLDGVDLDVEEEMSLPGIINLIDHLKQDFGPGFIITLSPVASALRGGKNLSGFSYDELYAARGADINWFNAQFYCGWGSLRSTTDYDRVMAHGVVPADKVVAGTVTDPSMCSGYVPMKDLETTIGQLTASYPNFGGVAGWEYFVSQPGGEDAPWKWAKRISHALSVPSAQGAAGN